MYIRFVVASHDENPWRATGIITSARVLCDDGKLEAYEAEIVQSAFDWFNDHLPCPPFGANRESGAWTADAVAWFVPEAKEPIARMWDLVAILKEHGVAVQIFRSESPGLIVYRDEYQSWLRHHGVPELVICYPFAGPHRLSPEHGND